MMRLRFGIPTLDSLLTLPATASDSLAVPRAPQASAGETISIVGPDGTGKSVIALHLASHYYAENLLHTLEENPTADPSEIARSLPIILYVSSDLSYASAQSVWESFDLGNPCTRQVPFERSGERLARMRPWLWPDAVAPPPFWSASLQAVTPSESEADCGGEDGSTKWQSIVEFLSEPTRAGVGFLDLAAHTAGDDWNFVNSILARLPMRKDGLPHLVIIDSIAGFETFVGDLDAHGLKQSRRARVAQCMRNARGKSNLVFVVEEPEVGKRLPEEYVTDVVLRLRARRDNSRAVRTVEVEKARARQHALGEHELDIRSRVGSSTGKWENADDPEVRNSYVQVLHSASHRNLLVARDSGPGNNAANNTICAFGSPYLDDLLDEGGRPDQAWAPGDRALRRPPRGLKSAAVSAIIGPNATGRSLLAHRFIADGLKGVLTSLSHAFLVLTGHTPLAARASTEDLNRLFQLISTAIISDTSGKPPRSNSSVSIASPNREAVLAALERCLNECERASAVNLRSIAREKLAGPPARLAHRASVWESHWNDANWRRRILRISNKPIDNTERNRRDLQRLSDAAELLRALKEVQPTREHVGDFLRLLGRHPNLRFPGILLSTSDQTSEEMASQCLTFLAESIDGAIDQYKGVSPDAARELASVLKDVLEEQLIVRRFDMDSDTPSALFHLVHRNILQASQLIFSDYMPPNQWYRFWKGDRIRLVIDDFSVVARLCPAIANDASFLPFLVFWLEREGVTSLFVHTDAVRPNIGATDPVTRSLQSLSKKTIETWVVPFEGQSRIAVSVSPASGERSGIVREIDLEPARALRSHFSSEHDRRALDAVVTPKLELYAGLDEGRPRLVPLAVRLFEATPRFREYAAVEDGAFRQLFTPSDQGKSGAVVQAIDVNEYSNVRDRVHIPLEARAQHTTIFQIDGFWALGATRSLSSQREYLERSTDDSSDQWADRFGLFRNTGSGRGRRRIDFFTNSRYETRAKGLLETGYSPTRQDEPHPDRVPFMWDFGFIMASSAAWEGALGEDVRTVAFDGGKRESLNDLETVGDVLAALESDRGRYVSWRAFLGACREVRDVSERLSGGNQFPFDFASTSSETLNALLLEIWLSEVFEAVETDTPWRRNSAYQGLIEDLDGLSPRDYKPERAALNLVELLSRGVDGNIHSTIEPLVSEVTKSMQSTANKRQFGELPLGFLSLYKSWLLLIEVLDIDKLLKPDNSFSLQQPKSASKAAVACRHWYRTACDIDSEASHGSSIVLRLPGRFITRGDSFLASPSTSRSRLLAWHAMDLLSSRRSNLIRLQMGLGLPVRDVLSDDSCDKLRTAIRCANYTSEVEGRQRMMHEMTYGELAARGGTYSPGDPTGPRWLFRNAIKDYDSISRPLQKWLARLLRWSIDYRAANATSWKGGFYAYDRLAEYRLGEVASFPSFLQFAEHCDFLVADLKAATNRPRSQ